MVDINLAHKLQVSSDFDFDLFTINDEMLNTQKNAVPEIQFQPLNSIEIAPNNDTTYALYDQSSEYITDHKQFQSFIKHLKSCVICLQELKDTLNASSLSGKETFGISMLSNPVVSFVGIGFVLLLFVWLLGRKLR